MAMRSSFVYGYGFEFDCDIRKFADFLSTHKEAFCVADKEKEVFSSFENLLKKKISKAYRNCLILILREKV